MDTRTPETFATGHIQGSINIPFSDFYDMPAKTMKTVEERREIFAKYGVSLDKEIVMTCQSGVTATVGVLAA